MNPQAKLSDLIDALTFDSEFHRTWFDLQTARSVIVSEEVMSALEQGDEEVLNDLPIGKKKKSRSAVKLWRMRQVTDSSSSGTITGIMQ